MIFDADLRRVVDDVLGANVSAVDAGADRALWELVSELGWPLVGVPEAAGGAGGGLAEAAELAAGIGRHAAPVPLVESGLAAWALAEAGLPLEGRTGRATVAFADPGLVELRPAGRFSGGGGGGGGGSEGSGGWRLDGIVRAVPWLPAVDTVVVVVEVGRTTSANDGSTAVVALEAASVGVDAGRNLADEPMGTLRLDGVRLPADAVAFAPVDLAARVVDRAAVLRAAALAGAVERACALVKDHIRSRRQFGRPLAALPAVRSLVTGLAVERDLLDAALAVAVDRPGRGTAAAARVTAAAAAGVVATGAHQLHGAMGVTQEYPLHRVTRRLWAWRDEGGTQRHWEQLLGAEVLVADTDELLWSLVTGLAA